MRITIDSMKHYLFIILILINVTASMRKSIELSNLIKTSEKLSDDEQIDITDEKYKQYFEDTKQILSNYIINAANNTKNYTAHQLIKIFSSSLLSSETNKTFSTNLVIRELNASEYYLFQIEKTYQNQLKNSTTEEVAKVKISQNTTWFNPQNEKNHESLINLFIRFLNFNKIKKEIAFYKGTNEHSCARHAFSSAVGETQFLTVCALKERNADNSFELGYLGSTAAIPKNISEYKNIYFFNNSREYFEKFDLQSDNVSSNFTTAEKDNKVINDYYAFMKGKGLVPENLKIDVDSNDDSEGGFNIVTRRSMVGIILTGVVCSGLYIGLFVFAKMNKKSPNDAFNSLE